MDNGAGDAIASAVAVCQAHGSACGALACYGLAPSEAAVEAASPGLAHLIDGLQVGDAVGEALAVGILAGYAIGVGDPNHLAQT